MADTYEAIAIFMNSVIPPYLMLRGRGWGETADCLLIPGTLWRVCPGLSVGFLTPT